MRRGRSRQVWIYRGPRIRRTRARTPLSPISQRPSLPRSQKPPGLSAPRYVLYYRTDDQCRCKIHQTRYQRQLDCPYTRRKPIGPIRAHHSDDRTWTRNPHNLPERPETWTSLLISLDRASLKRLSPDRDEAEPILRVDCKRVRRSIEHPKSARKWKVDLLLANLTQFKVRLKMAL